MKIKEISFHYDIVQTNPINRIARFIFVFSFFLLSTTFLLIIPFISFQQEINAFQSNNANLSNQLELIQDELLMDETSILERDYSNAYSYLLSVDSNSYNYIQDILLLAKDYIEISKYSIDTDAKVITISFAYTTESAINQFIIASYEAYGISDSSSDGSRWLTSVPVRNNVTSMKVEVYFYYA